MSFAPPLACGRPDRPLSIVVLLGGWSSEREVSLSSGRAVISALRSRGHDVRELDPAEIDFFGYPWADVDVVSIALHGSFGEDGTVQSWLEELSVPFTGSGTAPSRLAMSKSASKQRFCSRHLPTPDYRTTHVCASESSWIRKARLVGYPLVVKPDAQGSSIGVSIVHEEQDLLPALAMAFRYEPRAILERFVSGRELTVAVLDDWPLPVMEIRAARLFFDFTAKYQDQETQYILQPDLSRRVMRHVERLAVSAVNALGASGITRVDLRLDQANRPWLLEVNTIPGLTGHSLVPQAAKCAGIGMPELCEWLVWSALQRAGSRVQAA